MEVFGFGGGERMGKGGGWCGSSSGVRHPKREEGKGNLVGGIGGIRGIRGMHGRVLINEHECAGCGALPQYVACYVRNYAMYPDLIGAKGPGFRPQGGAQHASNLGCMLVMSA